MTSKRTGRVLAPVRHVKKPKKRDKGSRGRKIGRNKAWCTAYIAGCRQQINKRRKVARHCRRHPNDLEARKVLDRLR